MSANPIDPPRPAWREPLVWMVWGIPALTIVAGLVTWWIAAQRADSNVAEDWYKRGMAINRSLERESRAQALGLGAELTLVGEHDLRLSLRGGAALPPAVQVLLTHPVRAEQDRPLSLDRQPDGSYRIVSPLVGPGHWGVSIEAQDWRIAARRVTLAADRTLRIAADGRVD
ncbi:MAG TPA: FixH family protein [Burkholderiaceae bacterium]|nr:FixH family protein [Burkholderiaceae bacterium]